MILGVRGKGTCLRRFYNFFAIKGAAILFVINVCVSPSSGF